MFTKHFQTSQEMKQVHANDLYFKLIACMLSNYIQYLRTCPYLWLSTSKSTWSSYHEYNRETMVDIQTVYIVTGSLLFHQACRMFEEQMLKVKDVRILRKGSLPGMAAISFDSQTHCYHICCYGPSSTSSSLKCFHLYPVLRKRTATNKIVQRVVHLKLIDSYKVHKTMLTVNRVNLSQRMFYQKQWLSKS